MPDLLPESRGIGLCNVIVGLVLCFRYSLSKKIVTNISFAMWVQQFVVGDAYTGIKSTKYKHFLKKLREVAED